MRRCLWLERRARGRRRRNKSGLGVNSSVIDHMHWRPTRTPIIEVAYDNIGFLHATSFVWVKSYGGAIQARHNEVDTQAHVGPAGILFGKLVCEEACDWRTANLNGFGVTAQVPFPIKGRFGEHVQA